jgi:methyl coenzyme M reductase subunit D
MSEFLVAYFYTQLDAVTSARKLLTCGVQRDRMTIHGPQEPDTVAASSAQTTKASHTRRSVAEPAHALQGEEPMDIPGLNASTTLTVTLNDRPPIDDVCTVLKDAGAYLIDVTERNIAQQYPDM